MNLRHRLAAWGELISRVRAMWSFHWRQRNSTPAPGWLTEQEAAFLPAALSLQERPVSPMARWLAATLISLFILGLAWSYWGWIDIVVNAAGRVIPSARTKAIAAVEVASVRQIHVQEGQAVRAGQVLLVLDASAADADHGKAFDERAQARLTVARSRALIAAIRQGGAPHLAAVDGVRPEQLRHAQAQLDGQYRDLMARLQRLDDEIARCKKLLPLARQREADYQVLAREHDVAQHALLEKQQARLETEAQLQDVLNQRAALLAETTRMAYESLNEGSRQAAAADQDARKAGAHRDLLTLLSPVDGTVQQLAVHTVGGVVPAAQTLMLIVPRENYIEVEASVENKDIGFIREGQPAEVKIDAFNYTRYGTIPARVVHIARDAQQDERRGLLYTVKIALDRGELVVDGVRQPLSAGLSVNVEIKTGTRRVIEYVLGPLLQHRRESLNER